MAYRWKSSAERQAAHLERQPRRQLSVKLLTKPDGVKSGLAGYRDLPASPDVIFSEFAKKRPVYYGGAGEKTMQ